MEIKLSEEMMRELVGEALLKAITEEQRTVLVQGAIRELLSPKRDGYSGRSSTPLQDAFNRAIYDVAHKLVAEKLTADPEVQAKVGALVSEAFVRAFEADRREDLVSKIARAISDGLAGGR